MCNLRKGFISITVIILSSFFVTVIIAMNSFNSQVKLSNERHIIEKQAYYNAYSGLQRGIFEIRQDKDVSMADYFTVSEFPNDNDPKNERFYTFLSITNTPNGDKYEYNIESTGYGKIREEVVSRRIRAKITVDYVEKTGIIRIDNITID